MSHRKSFAVKDDEIRSSSFLTDLPQQRVNGSTAEPLEDVAGGTPAESHQEGLLRNPETLKPRLGRRRSNVFSLKKAAKTTMIIVRAGQGPVGIDRVAIPCHSDRPSELPRIIHSNSLKESIAKTLDFKTTTEKNLFCNLFMKAPRVERIIQDMYWYVASSFFQPNQHKEKEAIFYNRISENFTLLFLNVQESTGQAFQALQMLPDAIAQFLFVGFYTAYPNSDNLLKDDIREKLITLCYSWFLGFCPPSASWKHWVYKMDVSSPTRKILADGVFPALKNKQKRDERLEKIRRHEAMKHRENMSSLAETQNRSQQVVCVEDGLSSLPVIPISETKFERRTYSIGNSPLIKSYLERYNHSASIEKTKVKVKLSTSVNNYLDNQTSIKRECTVTHRRKKLLDPQGYAGLMQQFESYGRAVYNHYANERAKFDTIDHKIRTQYGDAMKRLVQQEQDFLLHEKNTHELSNVLVCKKKIEEEDSQNIQHHRPHHLVPHAPVQRTSH